MIPHPLDAVMFDMDGLLLDTEAVHRETMIEAAATLGVDWRDDVFLKLVGVHRDENNRTLRTHYGDDFPLDAFYADSDRRFDARLAAGMPLRPGVIAILDHLIADGVPRALRNVHGEPRGGGAADTSGADRSLRHDRHALARRAPKTCAGPVSARRRTARRQAGALRRARGFAQWRARRGRGRHGDDHGADLLGPTDETRKLTVATLESLDACARC